MPEISVKLDQLSVRRGGSGYDNWLASINMKIESCVGVRTFKNGETIELPYSYKRRITDIIKEYEDELNKGDSK